MSYVYEYRDVGYYVGKQCRDVLTLVPLSIGIVFSIPVVSDKYHYRKTVTPLDYIMHFIITSDYQGEVYS